MEKKFTVFISSTYEDLAKEREAIAMAILNMGSIPVGMEQFTAADESSWEIIQGQLDLSDYFVLVVAHRYGSLRGDISFVESEYNYAVEHDIPILPFFLDESASWNPKFTENTPSAKKKLLEFKKRVRAERQVARWSAKEDLVATFLQAFSKQRDRKDRPGWVRGTNAVSPDLANQLARLVRENSELQARLESRQNEPMWFEVTTAALRQVEVQGRNQFSQPTFRWQLDVFFHAYAASGPVTLPKHRATVTLECENALQEIDRFSFYAKDPQITATVSHLLINGPGAFRISATFGELNESFSSHDTISLNMVFHSPQIRQHIRAFAHMERDDLNGTRRWIFQSKQGAPLEAIHEDE